MAALLDDCPGAVKGRILKWAKICTLTSPSGLYRLKQQNAATHKIGTRGPFGLVTRQRDGRRDGWRQPFLA